MCPRVNLEGTSALSVGHEAVPDGLITMRQCPDRKYQVRTGPNWATSSPMQLTSVSIFYSGQPRKSNLAHPDHGPQPRVFWARIFQR